jgi:predicted kinase
MTILIITRGLPGSGKSTAAAAWVLACPDWRVRINRDDLRDMGHGRRLGTGAQEAIVTGLQESGARTALSHGTSVVVDDTNLRNGDVNRWARLAAEAGADFEVWDFRNVPLEVCIARDAARDDLDRVGEDVIRDMHERHIEASAAAETVPPQTRVMIKG